jgi:hypothetical protein
MIRQVHLDFRSEQRAPVWRGAVLMAVAVAALIGFGFQYHRLSRDVAAAEASVRVHAATARKKPLAVRPAGDAQQAALEIKRANEIAYQLRQPWGELFQSIESASIPEVALLSIESDTDKRRVKIAAEGKNLDALVAYLRFLEGLRTLSGVYLESHSVQQQDPQHPVRFVIAADWSQGRAVQAAARGL